MSELTSPEQAELLNKLFEMSRDFRPTELELLANLNERKDCYHIQDLNSFFFLAVIYRNVGRFEDSLQKIKKIKEPNLRTNASKEELMNLYSRIRTYESTYSEV